MVRIEGSASLQELRKDAHGLLRGVQRSLFFLLEVEFFYDLFHAPRYH